MHFGQWLRRVAEKDVTLIVEKGGKPEAVLRSLDAYRRLRSAGAAEAGTDALERARTSRQRIRARRGGEPVSPPEERIALLRAERDDGLSRLH